MIINKFLNCIIKFKGISYLIIFMFFMACQQSDKIEEISKEDLSQVYTNSNFHEVREIQVPVEFNAPDEVKNVILMIGDGMGTAQVFAGAAANKGKLNILNFTHSGFATTRSSDSDITDSAAAGTALACGIKTYNGAIGVNPSGANVQSILEMAEEAGLATGLVATCRITHATPASFIAHQEQRSMYEEIASDFLKTDIDVFIGGGRDNFTNRSDNLDLTEALRDKDYTVVFDSDSLLGVESGKLAGLIHEGDQIPYFKGRGNMLEMGTRASLNLLKQDPDGFFLMIEGSQIDWGAHDNNTEYLVEEMLDFDRAVGIVLDFAIENPGTLIIVTADHETGGFSIVSADHSNGMVEGAFGTGSHTAVMVPVFATGPSSHLFSGIYENTEIFFKMKEALKL